MRTSSRVAGIGALVVLLGTLAGGPVSAQEAEVDPANAEAFAATAKADALTISLFGQTITSSAVSAEVKPDLATAAVTETVLGPINEPTPATALQPAGDAEATTESCTGQELTQVPGVTRFDVTCGVATARHGADDGAARALGAEVVLEPSVSQMLETLTIQDPATEGANALLDGLNENLIQPLTGNPLGDLVESGAITVQQVINDVLQLQSTARVVVAPALAEVDVTACSVTATAKAQAIRVELLAADVAGSETNGLLPEDLDAGEPLVVLTLGKAEQTKSIDRCGGDGTRDPDDRPGEVVTTTVGALACLELASTALGAALGLPEGEQCLEGGQTACILEDTPLESCVSLAAATSDAGADAGSIQLFKGVNGGVDIATGRAVVGGAAAPPATPVAAPALELPRTGGPAALPVLGGGLLAAAAVARRFARKA
jgi:hypothetical protein